MIRTGGNLRMNTMVAVRARRTAALTVKPARRPFPRTLQCTRSSADLGEEPRTRVVEIAREQKVRGRLMSWLCVVVDLVRIVGPSAKALSYQVRCSALCRPARSTNTCTLRNEKRTNKHGDCRQKAQSKQKQSRGCSNEDVPIFKYACTACAHYSREGTPQVCP